MDDDEPEGKSGFGSEMLRAGSGVHGRSADYDTDPVKPDSPERSVLFHTEEKRDGSADREARERGGHPEESFPGSRWKKAGGSTEPPAFSVVPRNREAAFPLLHFLDFFRAVG